MNSSMTVTNTSLKAYHDIRVSGKLARRQYQVLENLRYLNVATNTEVSNEAKLPINQVTPRMLELRKAGLVVQAGQRKCYITGRTCKTWRIADWTVVQKPGAKQPRSMLKHFDRVDEHFKRAELSDEMLARLKEEEEEDEKEEEEWPELSDEMLARLKEEEEEDEKEEEEWHGVED